MVQVKTVDFAVVHQPPVIIVLKAPDPVLLCQLHLRKADVLIGRIHVHFPDCRRMVALLPQNPRKCWISGRQRRLIVPRAVLVHIQAAPERIARRCTDRIHRIMIFIIYTVCRQPVQIRRTHVRIPVKAKTVLPKLIAVQDQNVGLIHNHTSPSISFSSLHTSKNFFISGT